MKTIDFILIIPELLYVNFGIFSVWLYIYFRSQNFFTPPISLASYSVFITIIYLLLVSNSAAYCFTAISNMLLSGHLSVLLKILLSAFMVSTIILSYSSEQSKKFSVIALEIYIFKVFIFFSLLIVTLANHLLLLFFFLELFSLSSYILVAQRSKYSIFSSEAGIKYFIIGTSFSLLFLYGIALMYGVTGVLFIHDLVFIFPYICFSSSINNFYIMLASFCIFLGIAFKLSVAPLHFWSPDVYEGSPTSTVFFLSTLPKLPLLLILTRLFPLFIEVNITNVLLIAGLFSVVVGSVGGLYQKRIKRLLTYSSINNTGFMLLAVATWSTTPYITIIYLISYLVNNSIIFGLIMLNRDLSSRSTTLKNISALSGLFFVSKNKAIGLSIALFSSAGLPPFIGFFAKLLVLLSLFSFFNNWIFITVLFLLISSLSVFYYIRLIKVMSFTKKNYINNLMSPSFLTALMLSFFLFLTVILFLTGGLLINLSNFY